jgi:hypothetical protein
MYTLIKALCRTERTWKETDVSDLPLKELYRIYNEVLLILSHPYWPTDRVLEMGTLRVDLIASNATVGDWLASLGNTTLDTSGEADVYLTRKDVCYYRVWDTGFDVDFTNLGVHPDHDINETAARDLRVSKTGVDPADLYNNFLFTVNGFIHPVAATEHGVYIQDGNLTGTTENDNRLGMIDFRGVGGIEYHPIDDSTILDKPMVPANDRVKVTVDVPTEDRTFMVVLGGFLMPLDSVVRASGDNTVVLDFSNLDMEKRFLVGRKSLGYPDIMPESFFDYSFSPMYLNSAEFYSALLRNKFSFLVSIKNPKIYTEHRYLEYSGLPGRYYSPHLARGIVQFSNGKLADYMNVGNKKDFVISTPVEYERKLDYRTVGKHEALINASDSSERLDPHPHCTAEEFILYTY